METPKWMPLMPLNLQRFAEGANSGAGDDGEDNAGQNEDGGADDKAKGASKTFSQEDMSAIAAREAKKAREKLMRELGISADDDTKTFKDRLARLKEHEDAQKSDLDKAKGSADQLGKERDTFEARALAAERKLAAIQAGVPADKADRYVKLAESYMDGEDTDFEEAVKVALKDFPVVTQPEKKGSAGGGMNPPPDGDKAEGDNPGRKAAQQRKEQLKRSNEALKAYQNH